MSLWQQLQEKDIAIAKFHGKACDLQFRLGDNGKQGIRGSLCIFGVPEVIPGTVDVKVLAVCNDQMTIKPKIDDIDIVYRVVKPQLFPPNSVDAESEDAAESSATTRTTPNVNQILVDEIESCFVAGVYNERNKQPLYMPLKKSFGINLVVPSTLGHLLIGHSKLLHPHNKYLPKTQIKKRLKQKAIDVRRTRGTAFIHMTQ